MAEATAAPFEQLDFLYMPSRDVAADLAYFTEVLGGRGVFAIEDMGTRVAAVELTDGPPLVLLADHVEGERPILVYGCPIWTRRSRPSRREGGSESTRSRFRTGRAARSGDRAATGSRCTSSSARAWPAISRAAGTSDRGHQVVT